jgi:hypothetical protein
MIVVYLCYSYFYVCCTSICIVQGLLRIKFRMLYSHVRSSQQEPEGYAYKDLQDAVSNIPRSINSA